MENVKRNRLRQILDSLPQNTICNSDKPGTGSNSELPNQIAIPPGSVFENQLPVGRKPHGLFWCPDGIPDGRLTTLLSSRLGQRAFERLEVVRAIRSFFGKLDKGTLLVSADGITMDSALRRGSQLLGIPLLRFLVFPSRFDERVVQEIQFANRDPLEFRVYVESLVYSGPDHLLIESCHQSRLVSVRSNGKLHKAICEHAASKVSDSPGGAMILSLVDSELTSTEMRDELRRLGYHDWWLYPNMAQPGNVAVQTPVNPNATTLCADPISEHRATLDSLADMHGEFLSHWTRPVQHCWPDRSALSQWDSVWFGDQSPQGAAGTLMRILVQQTLLANGSLIRGGLPMCCFTEVSPIEFPKRRIFRSHLSRWDFEPFGISIRRSALESVGGRPVRYATRQECDSADKATQAWLVSSESTADWSREREWRVEGNLDLRLFSVNDVFVFVPNHEIATLIRPFSRWPIAVIDQTDAFMAKDPE